MFFCFLCNTFPLWVAGWSILLSNSLVTGESDLFMWDCSIKVCVVAKGIRKARFLMMKLYSFLQDCSKREQNMGDNHYWSWEILSLSNCETFSTWGSFFFHEVVTLEISNRLFLCFSNKFCCPQNNNPSFKSSTKHLSGEANGREEKMPSFTPEKANFQHNLWMEKDGTCSNYELQRCKCILEGPCHSLLGGILFTIIEQRSSVTSPKLLPLWIKSWRYSMLCLSNVIQNSTKTKILENKKKNF